MSKLSSFVFLFLIIGALFITFPSVHCQDESEDVDVSDPDISNDSSDEDISTQDPSEEVSYVWGPHADVQAAVYFVDSPIDKKFVAGEEITVLIGLTNSGDKEFNVSYAWASLHSPFQFEYFIQNFTGNFANALLPPHSETTVQYKFKPDINLEPLDFLLSGSIMYNDTNDRTPYRHIWFNSTITLSEGSQSLDISTFFTYVFFFTVVGGIVYVYFTLNPPRKRRSTNENGTRSGTPTEWNAEQVYKPLSKSRVFGAKQRTSTKAKKTPSNKAE
jgi:hypothetical protein